ncbi:MAG: CDP-archaeol synthase [Chitinophagales bacterium]|nr:CDP-archaeol synthase [Chitinophagales bacterium]
MATEKNKELLIRTRTAIIFAVVMFLGIYWNAYTYACLMVAIMLASLYEFQNITHPERQANRTSTLSGIFTFLLAVVLFIVSFLVAKGSIGAKVFIVFPALLFLYFVIELFAHSQWPFRNIAWNMLGIVYLTLPFVALNFMVIKSDTYLYELVLSILFIIWANDSFAYLVGSRIGKHKMIPRISPGKSWEGIAGGAMGAVLVAIALHYVFHLQFLSIIDWCLLGILISFAATVGDLAESMLKRSLGIKDSGTLLPGHGGVLDRFDAFYFAVPFAASYLTLAGKI